MALSTLKRKASTMLSSPIDPSSSSPGGSFRSTTTTTKTTAQRAITSFGRISKARLLLDQKVIEKGVAIKSNTVLVSSVENGKGNDDSSLSPLKRRRVVEDLVRKDGTSRNNIGDTSTREVESIQEGKDDSKDEETRSSSPSRKRLRGGNIDAARDDTSTSLSTNKVLGTTGGTKPVNGDDIIKASKRGSSLLERIRAKERHRATLPPPPSKAETEHRSALERLVEIVPILHFLAISQSQSQLTKYSPKSNVDIQDQEEGGKKISAGISSSSDEESKTEQEYEHDQKTTSNEENIRGDATTTTTTTRKISMPIHTLIQHLQTSLRNPISKEEAERSIHVLANEISPDWIQVVKMGKMEVVIILHRMMNSGHCDHHHHHRQQASDGEKQEKLQGGKKKRGLDNWLVKAGGEEKRSPKKIVAGEDLNWNGNGNEIGEKEGGEKGFDVLDRVRRRIGSV
ncbi:MAG: hypothetical protein M1823_001017 [Watsoniomyces obsoletus]|nr:MAG: hypothetical protein M1823_001017 [Watsoniomyces obsoletus]